MSGINVNTSTVFNPNTTSIDGLQALHQQQVDQAKGKLDINSLVGTPIAAARYNPSKGDVSTFATFQDSKTFKMMSDCFNAVGIDMGGSAEEIFAQALLGTKSDQDKNVLLSLMQKVPLVYDQALSTVLGSSEIMELYHQEDLQEDAEVEQTMLNQGAVEDAPENFKKFVLLLQNVKSLYDKEASKVQLLQVGGVIQQQATTETSTKAKNEELDDVENEDDTIEDQDDTIEDQDNVDSTASNSNANPLLQSSGNNSNQIQNNEGGGFEKKAGEDSISLLGATTTQQPVDDNSMPIDQENKIKANHPVVMGGNPNADNNLQVGADDAVRAAEASGTVGLYDNSLIATLNPQNTTLFLAFVMSYLQRASSLFDAIQYKSRSSADVAKFANDLLHAAQNLNNMMSGVSNKFTSLASKLKNKAGDYGITSFDSATAQNLGMYDLVLMDKLQNGDPDTLSAFGLHPPVSEDAALTELFLLKFYPALGIDKETGRPERDLIKEKGMGKDAWLKEQDNGKPKHDTATHFNGSVMWNNSSGCSAKWSEFVDEIPISLFGDTINSFLSPSELADCKRNGGYIAMGRLNAIIDNAFSSLAAIGFPKSDFNLLNDGPYKSDKSTKASVDFYTQMSSGIMNYSSSIGQNLVTELQQKTANSGKESQDDWAKIIEQIQKLQEAGSQSLVSYAKAC